MTRHHEYRVGDGATTAGWSDRFAGTVIKVTPMRVTVRRDNRTP